MLILMKLYIYLKNEKAMGLSIPTEAKWLEGNENSIPNDYDFWLNVRSNVWGKLSTYYKGF